MANLNQISTLPALRTFRPRGTTGIHAYYDGRSCPWHSSNWYDETLALGVAAYSIVSGDSAVLFDAGLTPAHAAYMLEHVRSLGAKRVSTVYSHFHMDHIAGASALRDTRIIAHKATLERMERDAEDMKYPKEGEGPHIDVVLPMQTYEASLSIQVGDVEIELHNFNVHTADSTLLFIPASGILFVGDMLEDTIPYISESENISTHVQELKRMARLPIKKLFPAHGSPERIEAGGFDKSLIYANIHYLEAMDEPLKQPIAWTMEMKDVMKHELAAGSLIFCEAYEGVHIENIETLKEVREEMTHVSRIESRELQGNEQ